VVVGGGGELCDVLGCVVWVFFDFVDVHVVVWLVL